MNPKLLTFAAGVFLLASLSVNAQQDPLFGINFNQPLLVNPAYAGLNNSASATISYRSQWTGLEGSPNTAALSLHSSFNQKVGAGLYLVSDQTAATQTLEMAGSYSYRIEFSHFSLSMGLQAGIYNLRNRYSGLLIRDPDEVFDESESLLQPNFGAGFLLSSEKFIAGLSVPRLMTHSVDGESGKTILYNRHVYAMAGGIFHLSPQAVFRPYLLLRQVKGAPLNFDLRADFYLNEIAMAGVFTRSLNQFGFSVGFFPEKKFRLVYQYELPAKAFARGFNSHEISLGINLELFHFHTPGFAYF